MRKAPYPATEPTYTIARAKMLASGLKHLSDIRTRAEIESWATETTLDYIARGLIVLTEEGV